MFKVEFVEPFIKAAFTVIETVMSSVPTRGQLAIRSSLLTNQQLAVVLLISGDVEGQVLYCMSIVTAQKIASSMLGNPVMSFDDVAKNAMVGIGDEIITKARSFLEDAGYNCDFEPVNVVRTADLERKLRRNVPTLVVPMLTQFGRIEIDVALDEKSTADKAA